MCETTPRVEKVLPKANGSLRLARQVALASHCTTHNADALDTALLLVSEVVTNSVLFANPPVVLAMECVKYGLRVRVRDGGLALPLGTRPSSPNQSPHGFALVDALAAGWGVEQVKDEHGPGKAVWFELRPLG